MSHEVDWSATYVMMFDSHACEDVNTVVVPTKLHYKQSLPDVNACTHILVNSRPVPIYLHWIYQDK